MQSTLADFLIDGKPYMLPRASNGRLWQEDAALSADFKDTYPDTRRSDGTPEIRINWDTKHKGFGEPLRRVGGRDYYGQNIDKRFPSQVILAREVKELTPVGTAGSDPAGFAVLGANIYVAYGAFVLKVDPANDTIPTETAATLTTDIENFQGKLFLARGNANIFQHSTDGTTWTPHSGSLTALKFKSAQNRLYRLSKKQAGGVEAAYLSNNSIDPTDNLNWSAEDPIGDTSIPGTGMASLGYQIFIGKEDGLYAADIETGRFPNLTPEVAPWRNTVNGAGMFGWGGLCFYPTVRGLKFFFSGALVTAGPEVMSQNDSPVKGRFTAMAGDANWIYGALFNGTDTYVLAGRNTKSEDAYPGEILWNVVWYLAGGPYTAMDIISINNDPRLWLARQGKLAYIKLGNQLDNPLQDSGAAYHATGVDYYAANDGGSPNVDKYFLELRVWCENLSQADGRKLTWHYRLDDTLTWTKLGVAHLSPYTILKFDQATDVVGKRIQLKVEWARGTVTTKTPVLRNVEVLAVEYSPQRKVITANIWAGPNVLLRNGGTDGRGMEKIVADLEALVNNQKLVDLQDPLGRKYRVLPLRPVLLKEAISQDFREITVVAQTRFLVV